MSKKRKGLSVDDKRKVILSIYHSRQEPFNLKEIETIGSKEGVVQQTIKEINQSLVDDFLVATDKIGAANFFWSFPSKAYQDQINIRDNLTATRSHLEESINRTSQEIQEAKRLRTNPGREEKLARLEELKAQDAQLNAQLEQLKHNDPDEIKKILEQAEANKEAANRWVDNIFAIRKFLTKKKGLPTKEADKILRINGTLDYLE